MSLSNSASLTLRDIRKAAGFRTADSFARYLSLSSSVVVAWEAGKLIPRVYADRLASVFRRPLPSTWFEPGVEMAKIVEYVGELVCMHCGTQPDTRLVSRQPIRNAPLLRCTRCSGPVHIYEVTIRERDVMRWTLADDPPRYGRPPRWLIEQRKRQAEAL